MKECTWCINLFNLVQVAWWKFIFPHDPFIKLDRDYRTFRIYKLEFYLYQR